MKRLKKGSYKGTLTLSDDFDNKSTAEEVLQGRADAEPDRQSSLTNMLRALRHRDFRLLWTGQAISLAGDGIYLVAIAWLVYDISNEPGALAIVGFAWTLPQVAGLLLAGVLSDRFERRRLLVIADLIRFAAIGAIAALAYADVAELWHLVAAGGGLRLRPGALPARVHRDRARGRPARGAAPGQRACASCWSRSGCASSARRWGRR